MSGWSVARGAMLLLLLVLLGLATRRDRAWVPLLAFFVWMAAVDLVRKPLEELRGEHLVLLHLDQALYLSVTFGFVWACAVLFESMAARWLAGGSWLVAMVVLVVGHDPLPDSVSAYIYTATSVVALATCWAVVLRGVLGRTHVEPTLAHLAAMVLLAGDTVVTLYGFVDLTPGGVDAMAASWDAIRAVNVVSLGLSTVICGLALARGRRRRLTRSG